MFRLLFSFFAFWVLCFSGCSAFSPIETHVPNTRFLDAKRFSFSDGGDALYYTFDLEGDSEDPANNTKKGAEDTVIFFISGSGCASVNGRFPAYFDPLKEISAKVFILQKRGIVDKSSGDTCSSTFYRNDFFDRVYEDQKEFIETQLRAQRFRYVVLVGASEGSLVAAKLSVEEPRVTILGMIGSGGASLRVDLRLLSEKNFFFGLGYRQKMQAIQHNPESFEHTAWGHSYKFWSAILDVDLRELLPQLSIPIVAAMGKEDESVPFQTLVDLRRTFRKLGKTNLLMRIYPNADHRLQDLDTHESHAPDFLLELKKKLFIEKRHSRTR